MHEASLVQGLLKVAVKAVEDHNAAQPENRALRIQDVACELGLFACVEPQTLRACFELFAQGTLAEGATLSLRIVPLPCTCNGCAQSFELTKRHFACPHCGGEDIHFSGGHGLTLMSLRVESEGSEHD